MGSTAPQFSAILFGILSGSVMIAILVVLPPTLKRRAQKKAVDTTTTTPTTAATSTTTTAPALDAGSTSITSASSDLSTFIPNEISYALGAIMLSFLFGAAVLFVYRAYSRSTLVWFGVTEVLWYLAGFLIYALQKIAREKQLRENQ